MEKEWILLLCKCEHGAKHNSPQMINYYPKYALDEADDNDNKDDHLGQFLSPRPHPSVAPFHIPFLEAQPCQVLPAHQDLVLLLSSDHAKYVLLPPPGKEIWNPKSVQKRILLGDPVSHLWLLCSLSLYLQDSSWQFQHQDTLKMMVNIILARK